MPLFYYICPYCGKEESKILTVAQSKADYRCKRDSTILLRNPKDASFKVNEILDNGLMPKSLERPSNAAELTEERNRLANEKKK